MKDKSHRKEFIDAFNSLTYKHNHYTAWNDFIALSTYDLFSPVLVLRPQVETRDIVERETKKIYEKYQKNEIEVFQGMFVHLVMELDKNPWQDLIGSLWAELEINSNSDKQHKGQFFTPFHVSETMAKISMFGMNKLIEEHGYIRLAEPTCGAGGMIIAAAKVLLDEGYNPQKVLHVTAQDVDVNCVHMTYIQLSLLGIPAIVIHGDTLSNTQNSVWPTAFHYLGFWDARLRKRYDEQKESKPIPVVEFKQKQNDGEHILQPCLDLEF